MNATGLARTDTEDHIIFTDLLFRMTLNRNALFVKVSERHNVTAKVAAQLLDEVQQGMAEAKDPDAWLAKMTRNGTWCKVERIAS